MRGPSRLYSFDLLRQPGDRLIVPLVDRDPRVLTNSVNGAARHYVANHDPRMILRIHRSGRRLIVERIASAKGPSA